MENQLRTGAYLYFASFGGIEDDEYPEDETPGWGDFSCWCCRQRLNHTCFVEQRDRQYNYAVALSYGGEPYDWIDIFQCPVCSTEYHFHQSNY